MRSLGLQGDAVTLMSAGGVGIVQFLAVLPAIVFIDRVGRRPLLRGKCASLIIACSILYGTCRRQHCYGVLASDHRVFGEP